MTELDFLWLLNSIEFPRRYWELCDRFPIRADGAEILPGRKRSLQPSARWVLWRDTIPAIDCSPVKKSG